MVADFNPTSCCLTFQKCMLPDALSPMAQPTQSYEQVGQWENFYSSALTHYLGKGYTSRSWYAFIP